ncbi:hypothetical protein BWI96_19415 [Siphonobacter sp. SORGH_AS_0500]|uniref:DUF2490 domain-containing protein n=1 Tax=Siphonobacter sp. SORGH_AS_0500 TaxID=1864824 RepID=UPI000CC7517E|nr:DUF2490 domain-containing protein [Siphonobacter sp. SORGH_AS_0500]PKK35000.1 hypothetical protein BWI96_19415 [Siphonobacter sp. SORGH_AS_0500]
MIRYLFLMFCCLGGQAYGQSYTNEVRHRAVFWTELNYVYKTSGKWSFQLDHQYRRQADDNGRDIQVFRHPLLQVFRPWVNYQLSKPVRVSLSPIGLWWNWGKVNQYQPITFFQEIRIIPQLQITKPLKKGEFIQRYRAEFRWPSHTDTLATSYIFLSDGESQEVLADRFNVRLRGMARWINPFQEQWYTHLSVEPMVVISPSVTHFDQNRTYLAIGRSIRKNLRVELGYLNQFAIQRMPNDQLRTYRFNHAIHVFVYLENVRKH